MLYFKHIVFIFIISLNVAWAQNDNRSFLIDHLDHKYILSGYTLSKVTKQGTLEYQNSFLGKITSVDVSNPLRILVFFESSNAIVFINNELSEIEHPIFLDDLGLMEISAICSSNINGFWVYNRLKSRVEFYDENLKLVHAGHDQRATIGENNRILSAQMNGKFLYLNVENVGILVFDMFANYIKTLPIRNAKCFHALSKSIVYGQNNQILEYDFMRLEKDTILQTPNPIDYVRIYNRNIYYQSGDSLFTQQVLYRP